jgi:hypothetical protein
MGNNIDQAIRLEETLAVWDLDEKGYKSMNMSSIILPSADDTITITSSQTSPYTVTGALGASFSNNTVYTTSGIGGGGNTPWLTQGTNVVPKIKLDGEGADIVVNGSSLVDAINSIRDRLNCLQINPELESEWEELRSLGDQYRKLEQQILEKQATWDRLRAMPPPEID